MAIPASDLLVYGENVEFPAVRFAVGDELAAGKTAWMRYLMVASDAQRDRLELALLRGWAEKPGDLGLLR